MKFLDAPFTPSRERGNVYLYLCDLLCSFATQHSFRSYFFVIKSNVVSRVASLLSVRDKHLCLGKRPLPRVIYYSFLTMCSFTEYSRTPIFSNMSQDEQPQSFHAYAKT